MQDACNAHTKNLHKLDNVVQLWYQIFHGMMLRSDGIRFNGPTQRRIGNILGQALLRSSALAVPRNSSPPEGSFDFCFGMHVLYQ